MALGNKRNILVGAAAIFIGPTGSVKPTVVTRASFLAGSAPGSDATPIAQTNGTGSVVTDWRNVGFTQDGLEVSTDPSYGEVEVDQLLDAALIFKDGMGLSISTTFAEATLENLLVAWGQDDVFRTSPGTTEIDILGGSLGEAPLERGLIAIGNAPRLDSGAYGERLYHAFRVLSVESASVSIARADASTVPITFRAMPDDNGKYGIVRDTTDVA